MPKSLAHNSIFNVIAGVSTTFGGFASTVLTARWLGVEGVGVIAFATWIVTVVVATADIGVPGALGRYLPVLRGNHEHGSAGRLTRYLMVRFLTGLAIVAACFASYSLLTAWMHPHESAIETTTYRDAWTFWALVGVACVTQGMASFSQGYLKGTESFGLLARLAVVSATLQVTATVIGIWLLGIAGAMIAVIVGSIIPAALIFTIAGDQEELQPDLKRRVDRFAWETWASYLITAFVWSRMEIFFLERSWGVSAAGIFSVSLTLTNIAAQAPILLTGALLPLLARHAEADVGKARQGYIIAVRFMALIVFPACLGMAAIAPKLVPLLFGAPFAEAVPTAVVLLAAASFSATASVGTIFLFAMQRTRIILVAGLIGVALTVIAGLTVVPLYGALAAAVGRGVIQLLSVALVAWYIHRRLHCPTPLRALALLLACALLCSAAAFLAIAIVPGPAALPAAIGAGLIVYALALKVIRPLPAGDFDRLQEFAAAVPSPLRRIAVGMVQWLRP